MSTYHLLLAVHLVLAVFTVGPLVHAATTAGRGIRLGDARATASASRVLRIYSYASVLVLLVGIPLMNQIPYGVPRRYTDYVPTSSEGVFYGGADDGDGKLGHFGETWIWLSIALWVLAVGLVLALIVPTLDRATKQIEAEESVAPLTARVAASGGVVGLLLAAIVVLMVYRPGQ